MVNLTATNPDGLQSNTTQLRVTLLDINDNSPSITQPTQLTYPINENSLGLNIQIRAEDADFSHNGTVYYTLDQSLNLDLVIRSFTIDPMTGWLNLITPLDYEQIQQTYIVVTCSDYGTPVQLKSEIQLNISVIDLNDNAPKFVPETPRKFTLLESTQPGQRFLQLQALDADLSPSFNQTRYNLTEIHKINNLGESISIADLFTIDPENGWLSLGNDSTLDHAIIKEYSLQIVAYDVDRTELSDALTLTIYIEPSRDKKPVFESTHSLAASSEHETRKRRSATLYTRSLDESKPNEFVVDIVKASDPNQYGIKYYIDSVEEVFHNASAPVVETDSNGTVISTRNYTSKFNIDLFKIGEEDGVLKANQTRSSYQGDFYIIKVRAVSKLNESLSRTVDIVVDIDKNSDSLFAQRVYDKSAEENLPRGHVVLQLEPKKTLDERRQLRYKLNKMYSTDRVDWFEIDYESGVLRTNSSASAGIVDCEQLDEVISFLNNK